MKEKETSQVLKTCEVFKVYWKESGMNRFRFTVIASILVLLPVLQACGGTPAPVTEATAVVQQTPAAPDGTQAVVPATGGTIAKNPSSSSPIAISDDDTLLVVANNLDDSVSIINVAGEANTKVAEVKVGDEPRTVAITPDKRLAYVTNQGSASVSVIDLATNQKTQDIPVGVEPYGVALTPDGARAYVANSASNSVSVIDTAGNTVVATISIPGVQPRGMAITNNNGGQGQQFVYVTQFLSQPTASGGPIQDQGSEGKVFILSTTDDAQIQGAITLSAHETSFAADRTKFGGGEADATFAYPNQLQAIVLKNGRGYLPNVAASPEGPVKFNVDTQAFLSVFDVAAKSELSGGTINLHAAVKAQTFKPKLFLANPWAVAFKHGSNDGYVASAASDVLVKVTSTITVSPVWLACLRKATPQGSH